MNSQPALGFSSLHDDIVMYIFEFNADMTQPTQPDRKGYTTIDDICLTEEDPDNGHSLFMSSNSVGHRTRFDALTITLRTSQVCRYWRQLLLASTAIWGRLIDLDILSNTDPQLRIEMFRRAGSTSALSVKGDTIFYPSPICDFVFDLVRDHWARLEWVNVCIDTDDELSHQQSQIWNTITTPAPNLRHFTFIFSIPITENPQTLTANAPALRELCTSPSSPLDLTSPWLHQLTFLSIDNVGESEILCTLPQFLDVLSNMPNIETLRLVSSRIAEGVYNEYQHIQLPSLRKLILEDGFNTCFSVLRHLAPSSQCTVEICAGNPHDILHEEYRNITGSLAAYLKQRSYNDRLLIDLQPNYASFVDAYHDCYPAPTVRIRINYRPQHSDVYAQSFLGILPRDKFNHVNDLWFRVNLPNLSEHPMEFFNAIVDIQYCLNAVKVLKTTTQGLMLFSMDDNNKIPVPLPQLQRVRIIPDTVEAEIYDDVSVLEPEFIQQFLNLFERRKCRGKAIEHLDVRQCGGDLSALDCCKGLKITWLVAQHRDEGRGEYICGSGNPKMLKDVYYS